MPIMAGTMSCVAGTTVPAFVERRLFALAQVRRSGGVAGTTVPAFVERASEGKLLSCAGRVSPGLRSRPSLSELRRGSCCPALDGCRRDYGPGLR